MAWSCGNTTKTNENVDKIKVIEEKITMELLSNQRAKLEKELSLLKDMRAKKGKSSAIFHLKDKVIGKKKVAQEATTMKHPKTKIELTRTKDIKEASINYCVDLLTNRKPKAGYEEDILLKNRIREVRMEEVIENDVVFNKSIFNKSLQELKKKNKKKYEFIINGGNSLKDAIF